MKQINRRQISHIYRQYLHPQKKGQAVLLVTALLAGLVGAILTARHPPLFIVIIWLGICNALLTVISFGIFKGLKRALKQPKDLKAMVRNVDGHSLRFLAWFAAHNLFWVALGNLLIALFLYVWGPRWWVLLCVAGVWAYTFYAWSGLLLMPSILRTNLALCWLGGAPDNVEHLLERMGATAVLRDHFEANLRGNPDLIEDRSRIVALRQDARAAGKRNVPWRPISKLNRQRPFWLEVRHRFYVFAALFIVAFLAHSLLLSLGIGLPRYDGAWSPVVVASVPGETGSAADPESVSLPKTGTETEESQPSSEAEVDQEETGSNNEQGVNSGNGSGENDNGEDQPGDGDDNTGQGESGDGRDNGGESEATNAEQTNGDTGDSSHDSGGGEPTDSTEESPGNGQPGDGKGEGETADTQPDNGEADANGRDNNNGGNPSDSTAENPGNGQPSNGTDGPEQPQPGSDSNGVDQGNESGIESEETQEGEQEQTNGEGGDQDSEDAEPGHEPQAEGASNGDDQGSEGDSEGAGGGPPDTPDEGHTPPPSSDQGSNDADEPLPEDPDESTPSPVRPTDQMFLLEIPAMQPVLGSGTADIERPDAESTLPAADFVVADQSETITSLVAPIQQIPARMRAVFRQLLSRWR